MIGIPPDIVQVRSSTVLRAPSAEVKNKVPTLIVLRASVSGLLCAMSNACHDRAMPLLAKKTKRD